MFGPRIVSLVVSTPLSLSTALAFAQAESIPQEDSERPPAIDITDSDWRRPLETRNQFPFALMFVSLAPDRARTLEADRTALDLQFDYSNIISGQESGAESVFLDLEYLRTNIVLRRGFSKQIELGVSIPLYVFYGGFLDAIVNRFHQVFGLPNFLRGQTPNQQVRFEYVREDGTPFRGEESFGSIGDLSVHFKKTLFDRDRYALAVRTVVKLPTGQPERLSGSGATDLGVGAAFDRVSDRWAFYSNASYHVLGQPESFRVENFFSFMAGVDYRVKPRLVALLQADHARPLVDGELPIFGEGAQQVALGLRWRYSDRFVYEWRLVEDLSDVSPDFTFAFQMGIRWNGGMIER